MSFMQPRPKLLASPFAAALLAALVLALPQPAHALSKLVLTPGSKVTVDKGSFNDSGSYIANGIDEFTLITGSQTGSLVDLTLVDFRIPRTLGESVFDFHFEFKLEDPNTPGLFVTQRDLALTWDQSDGSIVSETFRVQMTFEPDGTISYYDMMLTTAGTSLISCPPGIGANTSPGIAGLPLPAGSDPADGTPLTMAGAACALPTSAGVPRNDMPNHIMLLEINAHVPEPGTMLLLSGGLLGLGWLGRRRPRA